MVRVSSASSQPGSKSIEIGNGRGSPSDVFSPNIMQMERDKKKKEHSFFKWFSVVVAILCILLLAATVILAITLSNKFSEKSRFNNLFNPVKEPNGGPNSEPKSKWPSSSGSLKADYKRAVVATDHGLCSEIGRNILLEGGNAIEASIASLLCIGVVNPQSSGIGGGFVMTLYNASTGRCTTVDARETAPLASNSTMYLNSPKDAIVGYKSIATPGEIHGFWTVFNKYGSGKMNWTRLFQPSIHLAREGFPVSSNLALVLEKFKNDILADEDMRKVFVDPRTSQIYEEGDIMKREHLAELLIELSTSRDPVELFYKGGIAQTIAGEMKDNGGYVTLEDLSEYKSIIHDTSLKSEVLPNHLAMCGPPPPSSFVITQAIVGVMAQFYGQKNVDLNDPLVYHRLIEAEKFAFAQRTKLGDLDFVKQGISISHNMTKLGFAQWISKMITDEAHPKEFYSLNMTTHVPDHGTSHVVALDHDGNGVSVTSTINQLLGARRISPTLGIVWNDEMDDFSSPSMDNAFGFAPSPTNFIEPRKRPMSSMSPTIIYNTNTQKIKMIVGASGGSRIISSTAQTIIRTLLFNQTIKEAIDAPRLHNQFLPHITEYENTIPETIVDDLKRRNQNMTPIEKQASVVQALVVLEDGFIHANSDFRRKTATYPAGY